MIRWVRRLVLKSRLRLRQRFARRSIKTSPLREFVYLDEISVYSLIASRLGPLAAEFTDTQSKSLAAESTTGLSVESVGIKGSLGGSLKDTRTSSSQVLRKSTVQATFKELYEFEQNHLILGRREVRERKQKRRLTPPRLATFADLTLLAADADQSDVVPSNTLLRGRLFELEVRLAADNVYKFSHMFSTMAEIINAEPGLFPGVADFAFKNAESINSVIARLMVGLIPLRAEVVNYRLVRLQSHTFVVRTELLDEPIFRDSEIVPIEIAGVSEAKSYWQDTRRILFSDLTPRVFGRLTQTAVSYGWNPIKLAELLREAVPDLAGQISAVAAEGLTSFRNNAGPGGEPANLEPRKEALERAAAIYLKRFSVPGNPSELLDPGSLPIPAEKDSLSILQLRAIFDTVVEHIENGVDEPLDPVEAAEARSEALRDAGLDELGSLPAVPSSTSAPATIPHDNKPILEAEIVAIYW